MAKKKGVSKAARSQAAEVTTNKGMATGTATDKTLYKDAGIIFFAGLILALLLEKAELYFDWDTVDSIVRMNAAGYNPIDVPPVKYHFFIEPLVYVITSVFAPVFGYDNLIGFIVLVSAFSAGLLALTYYAVRKITGDRMSAIVAVAFVAISYNFLYLTLTATQNMVNQFFNLLAVLLALAVIGRVSYKIDRRLLAVALGGAIGLAVGTNMRSLYLLALLPLIVLLDSDRKKAAVNMIIAGACALVFIGGLALAGNVLGISSGVADFFHVVYYDDSQYWFFAGNGDIVVQASSAGVGFLRSFTGDSMAQGMGSVSGYLPIAGFVAFLGAFAYMLRNSVKDSAVVIITVPMIICTVNSFFYEPMSLERWDHAVLYLGLLAGIAWADGKGGRKDNHNKLIVSLILAVMAIGMIITIAGAGQTVQYVSFLYAKIPGDSLTEHPGLLVLSAGEKTVPGKYMVYLYGRENITYSSEFATAEDAVSYLNSIRTNRTVYIDTNEYQAFYGVNGSEQLLEDAVSIDDYGIWYRIDRKSS